MAFTRSRVRLPSGPPPPTSHLLVGLYFASVDHLLDIPSERQARELVPLDPEIQRRTG